MIAEALDFYVKATGRDGTQKREERVNMSPGELRRSLERWQARAKEVQRLQDKKEHAWNLYSRVPNFRRKKKEDFEKDFEHKVVYNGRVDEKSLQRVDRRNAVQGPESRARTRSSVEKNGWHQTTAIPNDAEP